MSQNLPDNPYSTPSFQQPNQGGPKSSPSNAKITAPGIVMVVLGSLGLIISMLGFFMAMGDPPPEDPDIPPVLQNLIEAQYGTSAMVLQIIFVLVNLFIIFGGIMMMKIRAWAICLIAAILLIVNINGCVCIAGLPVGIWAIVILSLEDVRRSFANNR